MGVAIPASSRALVNTRDEWRCVRCNMPGNEWHHRRGRAVDDEHQHCACNGIVLCATCHRWVHSHPLIARIMGWIVSRAVRAPGTVPVSTQQHGWVLLSCDGETEPSSDPREE